MIAADVSDADDLEIFKLLLRYGANPNIVNKKRNNLLDKACSSTHLSLAMLKAIFDESNQVVFDLSSMIKVKDYVNDEKKNDDNNTNNANNPRSSHDVVERTLIEGLCSQTNKKSQSKAFECLEYLFLMQKQQNTKYKMEITQFAIEEAIRQSNDDILQLIIHNACDGPHNQYDDKTSDMVLECYYNFRIALKICKMIPNTHERIGPHLYQKKKNNDVTKEDAIKNCIQFIENSLNLSKNKDGDDQFNKYLNWNLVFSKYNHFTSNSYDNVCLISKIISLNDSNDACLIEENVRLARLMLELGVK